MLLDLTVHISHVESLVLVVELDKLLSLLRDVSVDTQEGGNLFNVDVHKIFAVQILQQDLSTLSSVLRQAIQDVEESRLISLFIIVFHNVVDKVVDGFFCYRQQIDRVKAQGVELYLLGDALVAMFDSKR